MNEMLEKKLITIKESDRWPGLFVKKYTKQVFFKNLWNTDSDLLEARGHVELADGTIVIRPFTKIFNRGENDVDIGQGERCIAVRKVNGFMAAATWVPSVNSMVVSTTGSLDSDFVKMAEKYLDGKVKDCIEQAKLPLTFLFEIVDPEDPHIIEEKPGAYLIGVREVVSEEPYFSSKDKESMLDALADSFGVLRPSWSVKRFSDIVREAEECEHEGFVVYSLDSGTILKIKSPFYLCLKMIARRKDIESLDRKRVDEEYFPLIEHLTSLGDSFTMLTEQERLELMRKYLRSQ